MGKLRIRFPVRVVRVKTGAAQIWEAQRVFALGLGGLMQQAGSVQVKMEIVKKKKRSLSFYWGWRMVTEG